MNQETLDKILSDHKKWLNDEEGGSRANLSDADLRYADLRGADLSRTQVRKEGEGERKNHIFV